MLAGKLQSDRFVIQSLAGSGGMGQVYRARDRELNRDVAVKIMHGGEAAELQRFDREAQVLRTLEHPNIVRYLDHGTTIDGRPYLVLEWLEGEDLSQRLAREPIGLEATLRLAALLARALQHAHARGIVHRDVKPGNVFLVGGRVESVRLLDFGVARLLQGMPSMTQSGTAIGTPAYMAPEQANGSREVDGRADLFSLGCLLYECIAGRPPFSGAHMMAVLAKVLFDDPRPLAEAASGVPEALDSLVRRLLEKKPAQRPQSGDEVARLLEAIEPSAPTASAPSERPGPLGQIEQRLFAVVMIAPPHHARTLTDADVTVAVKAASAPAEAEIAATYRAEHSPLADGSSVAVLSGDGSASDLAFRAARCALAFRALLPALPIAIGIGRGVSAGRIPVGEAIDRAARLVRWDPLESTCRHASLSIL